MQTKIELVDQQGVGASAEPTGLSSLRGEAAKASSPEASIPSADQSIPGSEYIIRDDAGVFIFWPEVSGGAYNPGSLRAIARELERLNDIVFAGWELRYAASAMSASGQDPQGLEAKPASPVRDSGDAQ